MKICQDQANKNVYHRPVVKDYGNIRQLTRAASRTGHGDSGVGTNTRT